MALTIVTPERKSVSANAANIIQAVLDAQEPDRFYSIERVSRFLFITDVTPDIKGKAFNVPILSFSPTLLSKILFEFTSENTGAIFQKSKDGRFVQQVCTSDSARSNEIWDEVKRSAVD